jgi:hypothetical protein
VSDQHAINWYFADGGDTAKCSGSIDDYDGHMTQPAIMKAIEAEAGLEEGLFMAPRSQYGLGPQAQRTRP